MTVLEDALKMFAQSVGAPIQVPVEPAPPQKAYSDPDAEVLQQPWKEMFAIDQSRSARYLDFERMDTGDVSALLDAVVNTAMTWDVMNEDKSELEMARIEGFKIVVKGKYGRSGPSKVIETVLKETALKTTVWEVARDLCKYGDVFTENVVDPTDNFLVGVVPPPTSQMRVGKDAKGRFLGKDEKTGESRAYQQVVNGKVVASWEPWEMVHWKLFPTQHGKYSRLSLLDVIRPDWHKLRMVEETLVQARVTRSMPRRIVTIDVTGKSPQAAEEYVKKRIGQMFRKTTGVGAGSTDKGGVPQVQSDLAVPTGWFSEEGIERPLQKLDKVELEDPNLSGLAHIDDVKYLRMKLMSVVPGELIGMFETTKRDLSLQDIAFGRFIHRLQTRLTEGIRQIIDTALLLQGYRDVPYDVVWPKVVVGTDWKYADGMFRQSMAMANSIEEDMFAPGYATHRLFNVPRDEAEALAQEKLAWNDLVKERELEQELKRMKALNDLNYEHAERMQQLMAKNQPEQPANGEENPPANQPSGAKIGGRGGAAAIPKQPDQKKSVSTKIAQIRGGNQSG